MKLQPCESATIAARGYSKETRELHVQFKSGDTYRFADVPEDVAFEFMNAQSAGRHFHQHIRHSYTGIKLLPDDLLAAG